jgi:hypothetical protein
MNKDVLFTQLIVGMVFRIVNGFFARRFLQARWRHLKMSGKTLLAAATRCGNPSALVTCLWGEHPIDYALAVA